MIILRESNSSTHLLTKLFIDMNMMNRMCVNVYYAIREGLKKNRKKYGLLPNRGAGGSARVVKKPNCFFEKSIFQRVSRIILGPPKHVLHLVWSAYFISTAVRTALKVARPPQILGGKKAIIEAIIGAKNNRF